MIAMSGAIRSPILSERDARVESRDLPTVAAITRAVTKTQLDATGVIAEVIGDEILQRRVIE